MVNFYLFYFRRDENNRIILCAKFYTKFNLVEEILSGRFSRFLFDFFSVSFFAYALLMNVISTVLNAIRNSVYLSRTRAKRRKNPCRAGRISSNACLQDRKRAPQLAPRKGFRHGLIIVSSKKRGERSVNKLGVSAFGRHATCRVVACTRAVSEI